MSGFVFKKAVRENDSVIVMLAGGTGSGKTFSAMRLAAGVAGNKPFAVIDTEAGRAKHYADKFNFDHGDLRPPFTPDAYMEAIQAADEGGYPAIVVDSASHEWAGEGGLEDWHEEELDRMAGDDPQKRDALSARAWGKPKMAHKRYVSKLLQLRAPLLVLCLRAEEKIEFAKETNESTGRQKTVVRPKHGLFFHEGWGPICEKSLPYEAMAFFLLFSQNPGIPKAMKLEEQHRSIFLPDKQIDEECGRRLLQWVSAPNVQQHINQNDGLIRVTVDKRSDKNDDPGQTVFKYSIDGKWMVCFDQNLAVKLDDAEREKTSVWIKTQDGEKNGKAFTKIVDVRVE